MYDQIESTVLNPKSNMYSLLGEIASQPQYLAEADVNLTPDDAVDSSQKLILTALLNLIQQSQYEKPVSVLDVDVYLRAYPSAHKKWSNGGPNYLDGSIKKAQGKSPEFDYKMVKKYSYLRIYYSRGFDIRPILNYQDPKHLDRWIKRFRKMKVSDIVDYFSNKTDHIKQMWQDTNNDIQSFEIGDGIRDHIANLRKSSQMGYPFQNGFYNQFFGGMRKSKYMIRSTVTGGGKTRQALKDFCNVAFSEYFDPYKEVWVKTGSSFPALFISTELNKDELQNIVLAYLTGIDSKEISFGRFNDQRVKLIKHALGVIDKASFYFEYVEDFSSSDIDNLIDKYARQKGVKYVDFDYIQDSPRLMQELKQSYGNGLRSDQALVYLSKEFKKMAEKYDIFVMSATQVNGFYADDDKEKSRTEYTLRGGKSIADKVDYGIITSRFTKADQNKFSQMKDLREYKPNYAHHIYKNRAGEHNVIIWTIFNYGNLREKPLVVTDYNFNVLKDSNGNKVKPLSIDYV